eukprot:8323128-Lingulodinium_polyedra.AAC.1
MGVRPPSEPASREPCRHPALSDQQVERASAGSAASYAVGDVGGAEVLVALRPVPDDPLGPRLRHGREVPVAAEVPEAA